MLLLSSFKLSSVKHARLLLVGSKCPPYVIATIHTLIVAGQQSPRFHLAPLRYRCYLFDYNVQGRLPWRHRRRRETRDGLGTLQDGEGGGGPNSRSGHPMIPVIQTAAAIVMP